jgi:transcription initiation factor TFIIIB Brf1 subunit/transcription initiation factor TFIIB
MLGHCFACDSPGSIDDKDTGRVYCRACWNVIEEQIKAEKMVDELYWIEEVDNEQSGDSDASDLSEMWTR